MNRPDMNRTTLLLVLLVMFLSCGNSTTGFFDDERAVAPALPAGLTREEQAVSGKIDDFFTRLHKLGAFNGSVLVSKAGKVLYRKSLGLMDRAKKEPLTDSSMFQLASVSKVITATAVLMLHERGLVDIHEPLSKYFPDFPYKEVTIQELLNHRSGLPNYLYCLNSEICRPDYQMTNEEMYNYLVTKKAPPYFKPGRRFNYSNTNYALLGLLIEKISGRSYQQFLKEELFEPLGMRHSATILDIDLENSNVARAYDNRWRLIRFDASDFVVGDKSVYSTPYDLFLFSEALYNNHIISAETQKLAYTAFSKEQKQTNYGYGWRLKYFKDPERKEVYHNGWWHGYRTSFHRRLKDTLTVVILSNKLNSLAYQTQKVYDILDSRITLDEIADEDQQ
jgi:CubicO group peptidase (beta-lactamase class C family)